MPKTVSALKARQNLGQLLEEVFYQGDQFIVERAGRPMAAVVPLWQLEEWQKRRDHFFSSVDELWQKNKSVDPEVVEQEVAEAVQAVRKKTSRRKAR
jgi:prevent-host-death family protein